MKRKNVILIVALLALLSLGAKLMADVTMGDNDWIGLGASAGRIVFDNLTTDEVVIAGAPNKDSQLIVAGYDDGSKEGRLYLRKSDTDTFGTRAQTDSGDWLGMLAYQGVNTSDGWGYGALAYAIQDGVSGATYVPTDLVVQTYSASGANSNQLVLDGPTGNVGINNSTPVYDLDVGGDIRATNLVKADARVESGDAASDVDARTDMPFVAAEDGQGGYFFYNADVSADTDLTGIYSSESNVERQVRVEWLVYDVTAATKHYGETVLEYTGGITSVVLADEGANDLLFKVARGADPNLVGYLCLDVVGNHTYEVVLMTMWH